RARGPSCMIWGTPLDAADGRQDSLHDGNWGWRATRDRDIDRNHVGYPPAARIALAEDAAGAAAIADRHHQLRFRRRVVRALQRRFHVARYGPRDEQHVRVPRAGDEPD